MSILAVIGAGWGPRRFSSLESRAGARGAGCELFTESPREVQNGRKPTACPRYRAFDVAVQHRVRLPMAIPQRPLHGSAPAAAVSPPSGPVHDLTEAERGVGALWPDVIPVPHKRIGTCPASCLSVQQSHYGTSTIAPFRAQRIFYNFRIVPICWKIHIFYPRPIKRHNRAILST